jgi:pimeloyl-ACP methyl ester carboxylesterase
MHKRPKGILGVGWACLDAAVQGRAEHRPTSIDFPASLVKRISFTAGGALGWRISALVTPRARPAPWRIVVITGAPSWAEYWAPVLAALPEDREMIVVDRPGFAGSEPSHCVTDIRLQAKALAHARGQRIVLVGQSYGGAIATLMAEENPTNVAGLVLLSSYLGEPGPTARRLVDLGVRLAPVIPRDLRNAVQEIRDQPPQLVQVRQALSRLSLPVHIVHGEADDFAPIETAMALAAQCREGRATRVQAVRGANHFLNDGPVETVIDCIEACIPAPAPAIALPWRRWLDIGQKFAAGLASPPVWPGAPAPG